MQFLDKSVYFQIIKTKLEQIFRKTFWNITKRSNNNREDNKLIIVIHYFHVSDKWCVIVQLFINLSGNIYVSGTAHFNDCAYFFILIPYSDIWFVMRYFYCCLCWNIPSIFCLVYFINIFRVSLMSEFIIWIFFQNCRFQYYFCYDIMSYRKVTSSTLFSHNLHLVLHIGSCPESRWRLLIRNLVGSLDHEWHSDILRSDMKPFYILLWFY